MKVRELMRQNVLTIGVDDSWSVAAQMMLWAGIRHLPVVDAGRLVGVVSDRDLIGVGELEWQDPLGKTFKGPAKSVHPDADIIEVASRMAADKVDCYPVLEAGQVTGVLTTTDLLTHMTREKFQAAEPSAGGLVHDIMTPDPQSAAMDDRLLDVVDRMNRHGIRHLPIVDGERHVVGMVSDRDVRTALGELMLQESDARRRQVRVQLERASDVAHRAPITVREDAPVSLAVRLLFEHRVGALPVVDLQDRLVGIVSYLDVLGRSLAGGEERRAAKPGRALEERPTRH